MPYLHDYALGRSEAGIALLRDLVQPSLPLHLEDWPSRCDLDDTLRLDEGIKPFAYLFLGPRGTDGYLMVVFLTLLDLL